MKHKGRQPKRQPKFAWQKMQANVSEDERNLILSLTEGLERSESIYELIHGLTYWLGNVAKLERAKQAAKGPGIIKPTAEEVAAVQAPASKLVIAR